MKKPKQKYFKNTSEDKICKVFSDAVKSFMTKKGAITNDDICILAESDEKIIQISI